MRFPCQRPVRCKRPPAAVKLRVLESIRRLRLRNSTGRVLEELFDNPHALDWSNDRLAASLRISVRTVEAALAQLRSYGFVSMEYRRRPLTAIKRVCVEAVLKAVSHGVEAAKRACEAAKSLSAKVGFKIRSGFGRISSFDIKKGLQRVAQVPKTEKSDASSYLLRSKLVLADPSRR